VQFSGQKFARIHHFKPLRRNESAHSRPVRADGYKTGGSDPAYQTGFPRNAWPGLAIFTNHSVIFT